MQINEKKMKISSIKINILKIMLNTQKDSCVRVHSMRRNKLV